MSGCFSARRAALALLARCLFMSVGADGICLGETCAADARSGNGEDEGMSTLQVQFKREPPHGRFPLVKAEDVNTVLEFEKAGGANPECLQGLNFVDQGCHTFPQLWPESLGKTCSYEATPGFYNEFVAPNGRWDGNCIYYPTQSWAFGDVKTGEEIACPSHSPGVVFCQTNAWTHKPCQVGAEFVDAANSLWTMVRTEWGFWRTSGVYPFQLYYPVLQIVDGHGKKTKWFKSFVDVAIRETCPMWLTKGCPKSDWASTGEVAYCGNSTA